ncbi:hypothetical protein GCM10020000_14880 [Streptomyces olivoverticillatus]
MDRAELLEHQAVAAPGREVPEAGRLVADGVAGQQRGALTRGAVDGRVVGLTDGAAGEGGAAAYAALPPEGLPAVEGDLGGRAVVHLAQHRQLVGVEPGQVHPAQSREGDRAEHEVGVLDAGAGTRPDVHQHPVGAHFEPHGLAAADHRGAQPYGEPAGQLVHAAVEPQQGGAGLGEDVVEEAVEPAAAPGADAGVGGEERVQVDPVARRAAQVGCEVDAVHQGEELTAQVLAERVPQVRGRDGVDDGCEPGAEDDGALVVVVAGQALFQLAPEVLAQRSGGVLDADEAAVGVEECVLLRQECAERPEVFLQSEVPNVFEREPVVGRNAHGAEFDGGRSGALPETVGVDAAADAVVAFQYLHPVAEPLQFVRRHEARYSCPDDDDPPVFDPTSTDRVSMPKAHVVGH